MTVIGYNLISYLLEVVITDSIGNIASERCKDYLTHALCLGGHCTFSFNGETFEFKEDICRRYRNGSAVMPPTTG